MNEIQIDAPYLEGGFQLGIPVDSLLHGEVVQLMSQHDGGLGIQAPRGARGPTGSLPR